MSAFLPNSASAFARADQYNKTKLQGSGSSQTYLTLPLPSEYTVYVQYMYFNNVGTIYYIIVLGNFSGIGHLVWQQKFVQKFPWSRFMNGILLVLKGIRFVVLNTSHILYIHLYIMTCPRKQLLRITNNYLDGRKNLPKPPHQQRKDIQCQHLDNPSLLIHMRHKLGRREKSAAESPPGLHKLPYHTHTTLAIKWANLFTTAWNNVTRVREKFYPVLPETMSVIIVIRNSSSIFSHLPCVFLLFIFLPNSFKPPTFTAITFTFYIAFYPLNLSPR